MTAILGFVRNGMPILIGDILLSSPTDHAPPQVELPWGDLLSGFKPHDESFRISGLQQKLIILAPNLASAWAGT